MNDLQFDKCKTICGENPSGCFITNAQHVLCISDIIISKAWSAREVIEMVANRNRNNDLAELLDMAVNEMDELIVWAQRMRATRVKNEMNEEVVCG